MDDSTPGQVYVYIGEKQDTGNEVEKAGLHGGSLYGVKVALLTLVWVSARPFGLINLVPLPGWAQFIAGFLLLDLSFYYWHIANHKFPWLWRFHNVHHIDPDLDVSTGLRFHFGEVLLSTLFRVVQVSLIGT
jgi:sterol desaturase/sphingolipid hydroxylase (fatty acid hydroxylase superfamily)